MGAAQATAAEEPGPTRNAISCKGFQRPCSPSVRLWRRVQFNGLAEYVAYTTHRGKFCSGFDYVKDLRASASWYCNPLRLGSHAPVITAASYSVKPSDEGAVSDFSGVLRPDVARLQLSYLDRNDNRITRDAKTVLVDGRLKKRLRLEQPVTLFLSSIQGHVSRYRVTAFDSSGAVLDSFRTF